MNSTLLEIVCKKTSEATDLLEPVALKNNYLNLVGKKGKDKCDDLPSRYFLVKQHQEGKSLAYIKILGSWKLNLCHYRECSLEIRENNEND